MTSEVPVTFSSLSFCRDMILNHQCHKPERQMSKSPGPAKVQVWSLSVLGLCTMATVNKVIKALFLVKK